MVGGVKHTPGCYSYIKPHSQGQSGIINVMDLFESAKLKGHQINLSNLLARVEFKQQFLAPIRRLEECDQSSLLRKVISKEFLLAVMKTAAVELKQLATIKWPFYNLRTREPGSKQKKGTFCSPVKLSYAGTSMMT